MREHRCKTIRQWPIYCDKLASYLICMKPTYLCMYVIKIMQLKRNRSLERKTRVNRREFCIKKPVKSTALVCCFFIFKPATFILLQEAYHILCHLLGLLLISSKWMDQHLKYCIHKTHYPYKKCCYICCNFLLYISEVLLLCLWASVCLCVSVCVSIRDRFLQHLKGDGTYDRFVNGSF